MLLQEPVQSNQKKPCTYWRPVIIGLERHGRREKVDVTTVFPVPTTACTNVILQNTRDAHTAQNTPPIIVSEILNTIPESPITTAPTPPVNSTTSGGNLDSLMLAPVVPQEGVGHVAGLGEALTQVTPQPFQVPVPPQSLCTPHNEPVMKLLQTPETGLLDFTDHTPENCKGNVYEQENNKQQGKTRFTSPKGIGRKSKSRLNKTKTEIGENLKGDLICDNKPVTIMEPQQPQLQLAQMQQQSLEKIFKEILRSEPYHIEGMEIYSTTLWFLHKEVELSYLAQELTSIDKNSPEACCATGNCFSLQQEHETAIKFFNRAMQLNPWFAYAYTLLGHEFVYTEELDNAMACFRSAIRVSPRHYNAWFGVGLIYYKQEKFRLAEIHYRKALSINPQNSPLLCNLGMVLFSQQKSEHALATLDRAIALDPKNPLGKFHKATVLFAKQKNKVRSAR
ncbi:CDC27-like protein [Mya arenaria]|uniref:Cell division cycle protein 27 homolog n=1 Tax=Mya arenaria TaxID=6604 RepID=A0ABY7D9I7_MYAAR|nr:CDC27-like protein [Mya arenaria]